MKSIFKHWEEGSVLISDAGWGDSGKGKIVSALIPQVAVKVIGGHNAGHTVVTDNGELGLGLVPSSVIHKSVLNIISPEVVINTMFLLEELENIKKFGINLDPKNLQIDPRSHLILPWHEIRDALSEEARGKSAVGSLHLGVGWAYSDRINRRGLRFLDILTSNWKENIKNELLNQNGVIEDMKKDVIRKLGVKSKVKEDLNETEILKQVSIARKRFKTFMQNTQESVWKLIDKKTKILFEDSHGAMLDVAHGSWPFTTGVNTGLGGIYRAYGGKAVKSISKTIVCTKAYQTRVGGGPMPTEDFGNFAQHVRQNGHEFGTRSGRPRRCGAIDIPLLNYGYNALGVGQTDEIAITKLDVLTGYSKIPVCTTYTSGKNVYKSSPSSDAGFLSKVKAKYKIFKGWKEDISKVKNFNDLPKEAINYIKLLENQLNKNITFVGVGKHKDSYIIRQ